MSTTTEYIEFVCSQIRGDYDIRYKKMFGEYLVYVNEKPVFTVCDNSVFVKKLEETEGLLQDASEGFPYKGAKEHYILDIEDNELVDKVVEVLERVTPIPKKRASKKK